MSWFFGGSSQPEAKAPEPASPQGESAPTPSSARRAASEPIDPAVLAELKTLAGKVQDARAELAGAISEGAVVLTKAAETDALKGPKVVKVQMNLRRLMNMDTIAQTFTAVIELHMEWRCPTNETPPTPEDDDGDWVPEWVPTYQIRRLMTEHMSSQQFTTRKGKDGYQWIVGNFEHLVDIFETLELAAFPLDKQDLCVEVMATRGVDREVWVAMNPDEVAKVNKKNVNLGDFSLVPEVSLLSSMAMIDYDDHKHSSIFGHVRVTRQATYYMINVAGLMGILVSFTLCAWGVHPADIPSRHSTDFNLILTAVAFKLVLSDMLPPVSYLTLLDIYVMAGFLFLTAVTLAHTLGPMKWYDHVNASPLVFPPDFYDDEQKLVDDDMLQFYIFTGIWAVFNILYFCYFYYQRGALYKNFIKEGRDLQDEFNKATKAVFDAAPKGARSSNENLLVPP